MNYTKGEWKVWYDRPNDKEDSDCRIQAQGEDIAIILEPDYGNPQFEANAHLISAAPDMYEALKALNEQLLGANLPFSQKLFDDKINARKALAKAEGK